ncbi:MULTISPECIES: acetyl/propionyl/methylcrotonyl-CoA carboxylase subunit alpha [Methylosinus]|uniref:3-methylcrotonyl-CoA carboxylase n=1 Tax=Methylosinus trichosporium (strain ATCC 35070 / NCIMB 11131 / UNIQEM 75 / OB3b) TaxID=595536 RepID=A0A2D2D125_METT3|nr:MULTISPECIES: biotin carboxylase N-terminal domain-containing protein [Methylosinus]ATQ68690.1 3-methylcrotonyl-CoA carboxylase [Methylosinus trichosporium OB3b]OBS53148.1 3-methylcrotonyl-CoA carboxylase [Methylosinus sp. 3S-1]
MFHRLLIANRGEIACRVIATAKRLGVATIAVYSDADAHALHVERADEAFPLGASPPRESYLSIDKLLEVARAAKAEAVHPGYGFLSENADFAERCASAGLVFVGPSPRAMRLMGSKAEAKALMEASGAPVVPGFHGAQDIEALTQAAERIGFPLLVKASAGGGGKGMRLVTEPATLREAIDSAKREALAAFGDDRVLIEKHLERPRHIEVQIFGDSHGGCVAFPERDCSIQRRHQKIIEETPAPLLSASLRDRLREAALAAGRAVGYFGAGTVEFLVENDEFYFLEMNTRLQVEHPITEMIAGEDLVEWQLRIAAGERLPKSQAQIAARGHAIEARLYAEQPARGFLPSIGTLAHLREPRAEASLRIETGVREGDAITPYYDPMIAKIVAFGEDRDGACARLSGALRDYEIIGVETNLGLLTGILDDADFLAAAIDTEFVPRHSRLVEANDDALDEADRMFVLAAAAAAWVARLRAQTSIESPFDSLDGWRMNAPASHSLAFRLDGETHELRLTPQSDTQFRLVADGCSLLVERDADDRRMSLRVDGVRRALIVVAKENGFIVRLGPRSHSLKLIDPLAAPRHGAHEAEALRAPLPARVTHVLARAGDEVKKGATLIMLEAMKMEIALAAPRDARIAEIRPALGDMVRQGETLVVFVEGEAV